MVYSIRVHFTVLTLRTCRALELPRHVAQVSRPFSRSTQSHSRFPPISVMFCHDFVIQSFVYRSDSMSERALVLLHSHTLVVSVLRLSYSFPQVQSSSEVILRSLLNVRLPGPGTATATFPSHFSHPPDHAGSYSRNILDVSIYVEKTPFHKKSPKAAFRLFGRTCNVSRFFPSVPRLRAQSP